jgi:hypothetical protein
MNGFLIFIERENIFDANDTEKVNNKIIKGMADYCMSWKSLDETKDEDKKIIDNYAKDIVNRMFTTYQ